MAKKPKTSRIDDLAIEFFQKLVSQMGPEFPRRPVDWVRPDPSKPVQGPLQSDKDHSAALEEYEIAKVKRDRALIPEEFFVLSYLSGTIAEDYNGRHEQQYYGQFVEDVGRQILAELLKSDSPIPKRIREALATLVSPARGDIQQSEREFAIQYRQKGKRRNVIREIQISKDISSALDSGFIAKQAFGQAMDKYEISEREVKRIWGNNSTVFIKLGWLKDSRRTKAKAKR